MGNTTVFLIRHGEINNPGRTLYGRSTDLLLSAGGQGQIKKLAKKIKQEYSLDLIYSSPLRRALQTAKIISETIGENIPISKVHNLIDVDIPALIGQPISLIDEIHKHGVDEYEGDYVRRGNESREEIVRRMYESFKKIVKEGKGKAIAIISHGHPLRLLLFKLENVHAKIIPRIGSLEDKDYLEKGEAMKLIIDANGSIIGKKRIKVT